MPVRPLVVSCTEETQLVTIIGQPTFSDLFALNFHSVKVASDYSLNDMSPKLSGGCSRSGRLAACNLRAGGGGAGAGVRADMCSQRASGLNLKVDAKQD